MLWMWFAKGYFSLSSSGLFLGLPFKPIKYCDNSFIDICLYPGMDEMGNYTLAASGAAGNAGLRLLTAPNNPFGVFVEFFSDPALL